MTTDIYYVCLISIKIRKFILATGILFRADIENSLLFFFQIWLYTNLEIK